MKFRIATKSYGLIIECQDKPYCGWKRSGPNDGPYRHRKSAQSRMRALRKIDAERPDDLAARIMASRRFCVI